MEDSRQSAARARTRGRFDFRDMGFGVGEAGRLV